MVIVVGGGLIGSALALALRRAHVEVTLVEMRGSTVGEAGWDTRIYALSPGSVRLLEECGAWHTLDQGRVGRIEEMRVYGDDAKSSLTFNAYDAGVPSLAVTVEQRALQGALANALAESRVGVRSPAQC
jgi:2-octaprenylphenol hydroxylase